MLCLAFAPAVAFALIAREIKGHKSKLIMDKKLIAILLANYYLVFFYDLIDFASTDNYQPNYTHAMPIELVNWTGQVETSLQITYVFHHWSRPLAACFRNILTLWVVKSARQENQIKLKHDHFYSAILNV
jgi:hypothetical protein